MAGRLAVDDRVEIFPRAFQAKVRGLQVHGQTVSSAQAGQRTAVNLQGVERAAVERGDVIAPPAALVPTLLVDATLELLADAPRPLKARDRVRFHVGTQEVMARVLLVDGQEVTPGDVTYGRFRLEAPVARCPVTATSSAPTRRSSPSAAARCSTSRPPRFKRKGGALADHLRLLETAPPAKVVEEHLRQAGAAGLRAADLRARAPFGPERLRRAARRASAGPGGDRRRPGVVRPPRGERPSPLPDPGPPRGLPRPEPAARGNLPGGAPEPRGPCPGEGLRPAPRRPREPTAWSGASVTRCGSPRTRSA